MAHDLVSAGDMVRVRSRKGDVYWQWVQEAADSFPNYVTSGSKATATAFRVRSIVSDADARTVSLELGIDAGHRFVVENSLVAPQLGAPVTRTEARGVLQAQVGGSNYGVVVRLRFGDTVGGGAATRMWLATDAAGTSLVSSATGTNFILEKRGAPAATGPVEAGDEFVVRSQAGGYVTATGTTGLTVSFESGAAAAAYVFRVAEILERGSLLKDQVLTTLTIPAIGSFDARVMFARVGVYAEDADSVGFGVRDAAAFTHEFASGIVDLELAYSRGQPLIGDPLADAADDPTPRYAFSLQLGSPRFLDAATLPADLSGLVPKLNSVPVDTVQYEGRRNNVLYAAYAFGEPHGKAMSLFFTGTDVVFRFEVGGAGGKEWRVIGGDGDVLRADEVRIGDRVRLEYVEAPGLVLKRGSVADTTVFVAAPGSQPTDDVWEVASLNGELAAGTRLTTSALITLQSGSLYLGRRAGDDFAVYSLAPHAFQFGSDAAPNQNFDAVPPQIVPAVPASSIGLTYGAPVRWQHQTPEYGTEPNACEPQLGGSPFGNNLGQNLSFVTVGDDGRLIADNLRDTPFEEGATFRVMGAPSSFGGQNRPEGSAVGVNELFFLQCSPRRGAPFYIVEWERRPYPQSPFPETTIHYTVANQSTTFTITTAFFVAYESEAGASVDLARQTRIGLRSEGGVFAGMGGLTTQWTNSNACAPSDSFVSSLDPPNSGDSEFWLFHRAPPVAPEPKTEWVFEFERAASVAEGNVVTIRNQVGEYWHVDLPAGDIRLVADAAQATPFVVEIPDTERPTQFALRHEGRRRWVSAAGTDISLPELRCVELGNRLSLGIFTFPEELPFGEFVTGVVARAPPAFSAWRFERGDQPGRETFVQLVDRSTPEQQRWRFDLVSARDRDPELESVFTLDRGLASLRALGAVYASGGRLAGRELPPEARLLPGGAQNEDGTLQPLPDTDAGFYMNHTLVTQRVSDFSNVMTLEYQRGNVRFLVPASPSRPTLEPIAVRYRCIGYTARGEPILLLEDSDEVTPRSVFSANPRAAQFPVPQGQTPPVTAVPIEREDLVVSQFLRADTESGCSVFVDSYLSPGSSDSNRIGVQDDVPARLFEQDACAGDDAFASRGERAGGDEWIAKTAAQQAEFFRPRSVIVAQNTRMHLRRNLDGQSPIHFVLEPGVWGLQNLRDEYLRTVGSNPGFETVEFNEVSIERLMHSDFYGCSACGGLNQDTELFTAYVPGTQTCSAVVERFCNDTMHRWIKAGANDQRWQDVCGCFFDLQSVEFNLLIEGAADENGVPLPISCFGQNCLNGNHYRTAAMMDQTCDVSVCQQTINVIGPALVQNNEQTLVCGNRVYDTETGDPVGVPTPAPPPTPTPTPTPTPDGDGGGGFPVWAIVAIVAGVLLIVGLAVGLAFRARSKKLAFEERKYMDLRPRYVPPRPQFDAATAAAIPSASSSSLPPAVGGPRRRRR